MLKLFSNYPYFKPITEFDLSTLLCIAIEFDNSALIKVLVNEFKLQLTSTTASKLLKHCIDKKLIRIYNYLINSKKYEINLNQLPSTTTTAIPEYYILFKYIYQSWLPLSTILEHCYKIISLKPFLQEYIDSFINIEQFSKIRSNLNPSLSHLLKEIEILTIREVKEIEEKYSNYLHLNLIKTQYIDHSEINKDIIKLLKMIIMFTDINDENHYIINYINKSKDYFLVNLKSRMDDGASSRSYNYNDSWFILDDALRISILDRWGSRVGPPRRRYPPIENDNLDRWDSIDAPLRNDDVPPRENDNLERWRRRFPPRENDDLDRWGRRDVPPRNDDVPPRNDDVPPIIKGCSIGDELSFSYIDSIKFLPKDKDELALYISHNIKSFEDYNLFIPIFLEIDNYYLLKIILQQYLNFQNSQPVKIDYMVYRAKSEKVIDLIFETFQMKPYTIIDPRGWETKRGTIKDQINSIILMNKNCKHENYINQYLKTNHENEYYKTPIFTNGLYIMNNWLDFENHLERKDLDELVFNIFKQELRNSRSEIFKIDVLKFFFKKSIPIIENNLNDVFYSCSSDYYDKIYTFVLLVLESNSETLINHLFNNKFASLKPKDVIKALYLKNYKINHNSKEFIETPSSSSYDSIEFLIEKFTIETVFNSLLKNIIIKSDIDLLSYLLSRIIKENQQKSSPSSSTSNNEFIKSLIFKVFNKNICFENISIFKYLIRNYKSVFDMEEQIQENENSVNALNILLSNLNLQFKKPILNDFQGFNREIKDPIINYFYYSIDQGNIQMIDLLIQEFGINRFKFFYPKLFYPISINYFVPNYLKSKYPTIEVDEIIKTHNIFNRYSLSEIGFSNRLEKKIKQ